MIQAVRCSHGDGMDAGVPGCIAGCDGEPPRRGDGASCRHTSLVFATWLVDFETKPEMKRSGEV